MPAEDREEAKHFDAEEREGEYVRCGGEAGGEYRRCHEGRVGGERCREPARRGGLIGTVVGTKSRKIKCLLHTDAATVVEEENIDAHEPAAHGPDGIASGGFGQRFENGAEGQQCAIDQNG